MQEVNQLVNKISENILNPLIFLLFALATLSFLFGAYKYLVTLESEEGRRTGGRSMLWGIIGMIVMLSVYGIIEIVKNTIGVQ